jgi:hypothetical protein
MELYVPRCESSALSTVSPVILDGVQRWYVLEPPVRERKGVPVSEWKIEGKTAIPEGRRRMILTPSPRFSHKHPYCDLAGGRVPELLGVEGFGGVRWHIGNWPRDTEGCSLIGMAPMYPDMITHSAVAYAQLIGALLEAERRQDPVWVTYQNPLPPQPSAR